VASADHQFSPLFDETLVLVQAAGSPHEALAPITLAEVARLPLVIPRRPNAIRMQVESSLAALGLRPQVALEIDGVAAILELVADGVGVAVLSPHAVSQWVRPAVLRTRAIVDPPLRPRVTLATSAHRPATLTQQAAITLVRELCAQRFGPLLPQQADASALG
jgi:LysR family nitrogen assimilation transcriptional regulator